MLLRQRSSAGRPLAFYHDRHGIHLQTVKAGETPTQELAGQQRPPTQLGQALEELGIASIAAQSPSGQMPGGTALWGPARSAAYHFLAGYLPQFAAPAHLEESAYRPLEPTHALEAICCLKLWNCSSCSLLQNLH